FTACGNTAAPARDAFRTAARSRVTRAGPNLRRRGRFVAITIVVEAAALVSGRIVRLVGGVCFIVDVAAIPGFEYVVCRWRSAADRLGRFIEAEAVSVLVAVERRANAADALRARCAVHTINALTDAITGALRVGTAAEFVNPAAAFAARLRSRGVAA